MAINPVSAYSAPFRVPERSGDTSTAAPRGASGFAGLLGSLGNAGTGLAATTSETTAELLRIAMMQQSLSLGAEEEERPPTTSQALDSFLSLLPDSALRSRGGKTPAAPVAGAEEAVANPVAADAGSGSDELARTAAGFLGTPYRFGGEGVNGIDCSSFVQQVFREHQIALPRTAREQSQIGSDVAPGDLRKGDLIFFHTYAAYPSHVGIYLGDGKMIHASSAKGEVTISDINSDYYRARFLGARRVA